MTGGGRWWKGAIEGCGVRIIITSLLMASLVSGAPAASCCSWALLAVSAAAAVAGPPVDGRWCCQEPEPLDRAPCRERPVCVCGPIRSLFAEPAPDRTVIGPTAASWPAATGTGLSVVGVSAAFPFEALCRPPPALTLVRLHIALTI